MSDTTQLSILWGHLKEAWDRADRNRCAMLSDEERAAILRHIQAAMEIIENGVEQ